MNVNDMLNIRESTNSRKNNRTKETITSVYGFGGHH